MLIIKAVTNNICVSHCKGRNHVSRQWFMSFSNVIDIQEEGWWLCSKTFKIGHGLGMPCFIQFLINFFGIRIHRNLLAHRPTLFVFLPWDQYKIRLQKTSILDLNCNCSCKELLRTKVSINYSTASIQIKQCVSNQCKMLLSHSKQFHAQVEK